jgi:hypothetical protein
MSHWKNKTGRNKQTKKNDKVNRKETRTKAPKAKAKVKKIKNR